MRARLEQWLNEIWYEDRQPGPLLTFLERIYGALFALSSWFNKRRKAKDLVARPIIVVGNLNTGGAGKTPMVIKLCELARACGLSPAVVSRGYGRHSSLPLRVSAQSNAKDCGDEPYLIFNRTGVAVQVETNRERAVRELFNEDYDLVICDDGLQRMQLPRLVEICLVDQQRGFGNGRRLPAGPLREPVKRLESIDFVVEHLPAGDKEMIASGHSMRLRPGKLVGLHDGQSLSVLEAMSSENDVYAIAGISRPDRFFEMLEGLGIKSSNRPFPDHHRFRKSDFVEIPSGSMILMTEKDAVKCRRLPLLNAWYIPVEAMLSETLEKALIEKFQSWKRSPPLNRSRAKRS
ncbi:MAG: tetraacyldisaccharide 4'-kinase [Lysobacterales bacterium]|jgi:tetraacyldisaccharide 4'-kinase